MRIIIAGSRDFNDQKTVDEAVDKFINQLPCSKIQIISGGARGADRLGENYARARHYELKIFPARWDRYGKRAGYIRNEEMAENADALIAFWDGKSPGTKHMIDIARDKGLNVTVIQGRAT
jgi:hypothetical protein